MGTDAGSPTVSAGSASAEPVETAPPSAFTVVQAAETIEDVALRVYGTTAEAEALWRANRDALPRKNSPLLAGMMLRTPHNAR
jgi:nucleoid-associated protein YgaU